MLALSLTLAATALLEPTGQHERIIAHSLTREFKSCMIADANSGNERACWKNELLRQDQLLASSLKSASRGFSVSEQKKLKLRQSDWAMRREHVCKSKSNEGSAFDECRLYQTILRRHDIMALPDQR